MDEILILLTQVDQLAQQEAKRDGHNEVRVATLSVVHKQEGYGRNYGYRQFMPPSDVKYVV